MLLEGAAEDEAEGQADEEDEGDGHEGLAGGGVADGELALTGHVAMPAPTTRWFASS